VPSISTTTAFRQHHIVLRPGRSRAQRAALPLEGPGLVHLGSPAGGRRATGTAPRRSVDNRFAFLSPKLSPVKHDSGVLHRRHRTRWNLGQTRAYSSALTRTRWTVVKALITRRSWVQIPPPPPSLYEGPGQRPGPSSLYFLELRSHRSFVRRRVVARATRRRATSRALG